MGLIGLKNSAHEIISAHYSFFICLVEYCTVPKSTPKNVFIVVLDLIVSSKTIKKFININIFLTIKYEFLMQKENLIIFIGCYFLERKLHGIVFELTINFDLTQ